VTWGQQIVTAAVGGGLVIAGFVLGVISAWLTERRRP
jgi:hypothetical protein